MKTDLATSIGVAIVGILISYFVCNMLVPGSTDREVKTISSSFTADVAEPNIEVFNYKALNPTVEVYVGTCDEYDEEGNCIYGENVTTVITDVSDDSLTAGGEDQEKP